MDFKCEIEKMKLIDISDEEFNINEIPNNVRKSIGFYNKAIVDLKISSVDMAISDLKKSLALNSGFCEALKLLGLCYVRKKDFKRAESTFKKLYKHSVYSVMAKNYIKDLREEKMSPKTVDTIKAIEFDSEGNPRNSKMINKKSSFKKIAAISLASTIIIVGLGAIYWTKLNTKPMANKAAITKVVDSKAQNNLAADQGVIKKDKTEIKKAEIAIDKAKVEQDNYKNNVILKLDDAERFYENGDYEKAVDNLLVIKTFQLKDSEKSRFDSLWSDIKTKDVWNIYNSANKLYKEGKYQEALPKLIKVQELAPDLNIMPWVLYQTGVCYKESNDNKNALVLFKKVKSNYPNSEYAGYSENMINEIGAK